MWRSTFCLLALAICGGGCTRQQASGSGITQFWSDDYKVFDQIYGKTSDKDIFGATLPPSISFGIDATKLKQVASEKQERFIENHQNPYLDEDQDPYGFGSKYPSLTNQGVIKSVKPPKIPTKFIPANFKPIISKNNDPETYEYLKHLELLQKKKENFLLKNAGGFKPYNSYQGGVASEDTDGYRSIQDILEAHEANKGKNTDDDESDGQVKYLTYGRPKHRGPVKKVKPTGPLVKGKPQCHSGRCRKRGTVTYRGRTYLTRPMVRKIKKIIYH